MDARLLRQLIEEVPAPVIEQFDAGRRVKVASYSAALVGTAGVEAGNLLSWTASDDTIIEVVASVLAVTAQTAIVRLELEIEAEGGGPQYSEVVPLKALGDFRQFRTLRRFIKDDWSVKYNLVDELALNETIHSTVYVYELRG